MASYLFDKLNYSGFKNIPGAVYTRSGVEYQQNAEGVWTSFDENVPPISAGVGVDVWEARTNSIRNPTGLGAVAGTPGTAPTYWNVLQTAYQGISRQVVGFGTTSSGLPYVDIRYSGTTTASGYISAPFEVAGVVTASQGQTWTHSCYMALVGGSLANLTSATLRIAQHGDAAVYLGEVTGTAPSLMGLTANLTKVTVSGVAADASVISVSPYWQIYYPNGVAVDFTLRIAAPNLKLGANINDPPILQTNNAAATRGAASAYLNAPGLIVPALGVTVVAEVEWPRYTNVSAVFVEPWNAGGGSPAGFTLSADNGGNRPRIVLRQGSGRFDTGSNANVVAAGATVKFGLSFNAVGGVASSQGQSVNSSFTPSQSDYAGEPIYFGSRNGSSNFANTNIRKVQFLQGLRTQAELNALTTA